MVGDLELNLGDAIAARWQGGREGKEVIVLSMEVVSLKYGKEC